MTGSLPEWGFSRMTAISAEIILWGNRFEGSLLWLRSMSGLMHYIADSNKFKGSILTHTFPNHLDYLCIYSNQLAGALPEEGLFSVSVLTALHAFANSLRGSLPEIGLHQLSLMVMMDVGDNHHSGTLPAIGFHGMSPLLLLWLQRNAFTGALPEDGFGHHPWHGFCVQTNPLEGQLPALAVRQSDLKFIVAGDTGIEGSIPPSLGNLQANLIAVSLPKLHMQG
eukprot:4970971-Amphidinium_carterae.1